MDQGWWNNILLVVLGFGALLFTTGVYALYWASRNGQLNDFEAQARSIFDEDEPEGERQDSFPEEDVLIGGKRSPSHPKA